MTEIQIEQIMHEMTHQKIRSSDGEKWGAVPMCQDTIMQVYTYIWESNYPEGDKKYFLEILDRWKKGDFSDIVSDHNKFWGDESGTVGLAVGKATPEEEAQFVLLHFGLYLPALRTIPL
jgi:hypothetical protein